MCDASTQYARKGIKAIVISCILVLLCGLVVVSGTVLGAILSWGYTYFCITPMYQASATIFVNNNRDTGDKDSLTSSDLTASIQLVKDYMIVAKSDMVLTQVAEELNADAAGNKYTSDQLRRSITTSQIDDTIIFAVRVSHKDPNEAAKIANVVARTVCDIGPYAIEGTTANILDSARTPTSPYYPNYMNNLLIGAGIGTAIALLITFTIIALWFVIKWIYNKRKCG